MLESTGIEPDHMPGNIRRIRGFIRAAASLEKNAERTSQLLSKLLEYRKSDQLNAQAALLTTLIERTNAQGTELRNLAYESRTDGRYARILGFVATLYLPASLLASIFSSDLVQLSQVASALSGPQILYVSPAMWVFALLSLSLTGITLAGTFWRIRREK